MDTRHQVHSSEHLPYEPHPGESLVELSRDCLDAAIDYSYHTQHEDGHWCGEVRSNVTATAEYIFLHQALGIDLTSSRDLLCQWLLSQQRDDGSWSLAPGYPGNVSFTVEAYLALKILRISPEDPAMQRARLFVLGAGGVAKVSMLTRINLAILGLFSWDDVPALPVELILLPSWAPINIYRFSSWARLFMVPVLILCHHRPVLPLPNGTSASSNCLDELWCGSQKNAPYCRPLHELLRTDRVAFSFAVMDKVLSSLNGLRSFIFRTRARRVCVEWILEHQETSGDWGGIFPAMHANLLALLLEGYKVEDDCMQRGLSAMGRFVWQDDAGRRLQACVGPVWDTALMSIGLSDSGVLGSIQKMTKAVQWVQDRQLLNSYGDWRVYSPNTRPGGFSFEYFNSWYPDLDDTAVVILAFLKQDPSRASSSCVLDAIEWILGMQNKDGGWAAFDINNDALFLNRIPFSDMDCLADPSSPDVTGHVLEAFGLFISITMHRDNKSDPSTTTSRAYDLTNRVNASLVPALTYLAHTQEPDTGAWYGRWGVNYIFGTSNVLCGLASLPKVYTLPSNLDSSQTSTTSFYKDGYPKNLAGPALDWLKQVQNPDGGFGESVQSYDDAALAGCGPSTPTQTAWGVMGLLAFLPPEDAAVERGVRWLVRMQRREKGGDGAEGNDNTGATWRQDVHTATGFPGHCYLEYDLYRHHFPMMALGRYCSQAAKGGERKEGRGTVTESIVA